jgi:flagellar protein FliO/FliZ
MNSIASVLWFIAVLAMIPLALWLLKRTPMGGAAAHGHLRTIAALPLSPSQRIVIVEVGQGEAARWLVLGITAQQINTLYSLPPQAVSDVGTVLQGAAAQTPFAQLMAKLKK